MSDTAHQIPEDLSIVTAVYNHQDTVADTLDSILMQQTTQHFHVYCLNDASTDNSAEVLTEYQARHPDKITVFTSTQNQGTGKKSILHHRPPVLGRYWTLLAGDDYWTTPDKVEQQIALLDQNPTAAGCCSHTVMKNEQTGEETLIHPSKQRWNLMDLVLKRHSLYVHPSSIIWRNTFLKDGYFLPPQFIKADVTGDTVLSHMVLARGGELINHPHVTSCYRVTGHGVWSKLSQDEQNALNEKVAGYLMSWLPLKYRIARKFFRSKKLSKFAGMLPQPLNR